MTELRVDKHIQAARRELRVHAWDANRVDAAFRELGLRRLRDRPRRQRLVRVGGAALAAALFVLALVALRMPWSSPGPGPGARVTAPVFERLALGDAEVRFRPGTQLEVRERSDTRVVLTMREGRAHFAVRHDPRRLFRVEVGAVDVEDLGTVFEIENTGSSVRVSVTEGSVAVSFPESPGRRGRATLNAGQSGVYPAVAVRTEPASADTAAAGDVPGPSASSDAAGRYPSATAVDWRELARAGKHLRAYELIAPDFRDVRDEAGELLLASDVARLSRHPAAAALLLRKLLAGHARDSRAPSAAFTLGWILMNELGRPREAALAFARAEALAPRGNLAEDAVARSVEAWYRAGELSRAKAEVERYEKTYPRGRHQVMLKRLVMKP